MACDKHNTQSVNLYEAQQKVYPREVKNGRYDRLRKASVFILLGLYYLVPWLSWGDRQAVLFDMPARKFHIFSLTMWPQDFFFLALLLVMAGLSLFFFTALAGRVWCGFACPQTVWTEVFIWMERWVEGSRQKQIKLSEMPWNAEKIRKRVLKQFLWITFSLWTGITFVGYFVPIKEIVSDIALLQISGWTAFWMVFYSFATYGNAGFMREQVCQYMCPYARFQGAMFDSDTLIISYDEKRGEPRERGKRRKEETEDKKGDCIDCGLCVQVCPTGIDIREGLQYECIACAACIDVCDQVMDSIDLPRGLIKYSTEAIDEGQNKTLLASLIRPRTIIYAVLLSVFAIGFAIALFSRSAFEVDISRDRNALYRMVGTQTVENVYHVKVINKSQLAQRYTISVEGLDNATVEWLTADENKLSDVVESGKIGGFTVLVHQPLSSQQNKSQLIKLKVTEINGDKAASVIEPSRFWGPKVN